MVEEISAVGLRHVGRSGGCLNRCREVPMVSGRQGGGVFWKVGKNTGVVCILSLLFLVLVAFLTQRAFKGNDIRLNLC